MLSFRSEAQRQAHPEARLIPVIVWNTFFKQGLSDEIIQLMKQGRGPFDSDSVKHDPATWLAFAYSHPELDDTALIEAANQMQLPAAEQLRLSAALGRASLFDRLYDGFDKTYLLTLLEANQYEIFRIAARLGHQPILQKIFDFKNPSAQAGKEVLTSLAIALVSAGLMELPSYFGFLGLAMEAIRPALTLPLTNMLESPLNEQAIAAALHEVTEQKETTLLATLLAIAPDKTLKIIAAHDYQFLHEAANKENWPLVEMIFDHSENHTIDMLTSHFHQLLKHKSLDLNNILKKAIPRAFNEAIKSQRFLKMIHLLNSLSPEEAITLIKQNNHEALIVAIAHNYISLIFTIEHYLDIDKMLDDGDLTLFKNPLIAHYYHQKINERLIKSILDGDIVRMKKYAEICIDKEKILVDYRHTQQGILWGFFGSYEYNILMKIEGKNRKNMIIALLESVPNKAQELILYRSSSCPSMLREAYKGNQTKLLTAYFPYVFSDIANDPNYSDITIFFINQQISRLRTNPQEIQQIVLNEKTVKLNLSIMLRLISEKNRQADFNFLFHIPTLKTMLGDNPEPFFRAAYQANNTAVIHQLCRILFVLKKANESCFYSLLGEAAEANTVLTLFNYAKDKKKLLSHDKYKPIYTNIRQGNVNVLKTMFDYTNDKTLDILQKNNYEAFSWGPLSTEMFELLSGYLDPIQTQQMLQAWEYSVFRNAVKAGNLALVNQIIPLIPPENREDMLETYDYAAFFSACGQDNGPLFTRVMELVSSTKTLKSMLTKHDYRAFYLAAEGNTAVFEQLLQDKYWQYLPQDQVSAIIHSNHDASFREAASSGNLWVVNRLLALTTTSEKLNSMLSACDFEAFNRTQNTEIRKKLLPFLPVFIHAESHDSEYRNDVRPFVDQQLILLHQKMSTFEYQNPHGVFDLPSEEATFAFYMLRHLIRRNDRNLEDNIRFLLNIPAVKALVHQEVTPGRPNELFELAMTTNNQQAVSLLLTIPEINRIAREQNYYRNDRQNYRNNGENYRNNGENDLDIAALARDAESSMQALSQDEAQRLDAVIQRYKPQLKEGTDKIMARLRKQLAQRYQAHPATLVINHREIKLPLDWEDFQDMKLELKFTTEDSERALKAYYQNKDHTALRYLSKPNHWMHTHASYVNREPNSQNQWSTFPEYENLVSVLFLATQDPDKTLLCDDHTVATRMDHFVDELAHIGRAHNWDERRIKKNQHGKISYDKRGQTIYEYYDRLDGDKPSCYSGVKRRLFQAVQGHMLLKTLSLDMVKLELREFIRNYYAEQINDSNRMRLKEAWENTVNNTQMDDRLHELDIPKQKQQAFIQYMNQKYPKYFPNDPVFNLCIQNQFRLDDTCQAHAIRFYEDADLGTLLQTTHSHQVEENMSTPLPPQDITPIFKLSLSLKKCPQLGEAIINELACLKPNHTHVAAIWVNAPEKLNAIINAINALPEVSDEQLHRALSDPESTLSQALLQKPTVDCPFREAIQQIVEQSNWHTPRANI